MKKIKLILFDLEGTVFNVGYFERYKNIAASSWAFIHDLNLKPEECALVGDGVNDIPIAKEVGL